MTDFGRVDELGQVLVQLLEVEDIGLDLVDELAYLHQLPTKAPFGENLSKVRSFQASAHVY